MPETSTASPKRKMPFTGLAPASMEVSEIPKGITVKLTQGSNAQVSVTEDRDGKLMVAVVNGDTHWHGPGGVVVSDSTVRNRNRKRSTEDDQD